MKQILNRAKREVAPRARVFHQPPKRAARRAVFVNDVHSQLNRARVRRIAKPRDINALQTIVRQVCADEETVAVAGGRHAMGGQQFKGDGVLVDMTGMSRVLSFDAARGLIEVEAGIEWPEMIAWLAEAQKNSRRQFGIIQKQTGADRLSVGGALAANIHGRGLTLKPFIGDIESFVLVDAEGAARTCSRRENSEMFRLAVGGYGLFGIVASVKLRLAPRKKLVRVVELIETSELMQAFERRISDGFLYGDFQFVTDESADDFLRRGIFSCYRPVADRTPLAESHRELSAQDWSELCYLAHTNRKQAFELYAAHYLSTSGQIYWSDTHQLSVYLDDYHRALDHRLNRAARGSEMITEAYVPRAALPAFMETAREDFRRHEVELIYGTVRLIRRDDESFLAWARDSFACVVFNLHVTHTEAGIEKARRDFRRLIERAIQFGGNYYLTYHRHATRRQVEACYPQFAQFLRLKRKYDPAERFQSDWYHHYRTMFAGDLSSHIAQER